MTTVDELAQRWVAARLGFLTELEKTGGIQNAFLATKKSLGAAPPRKSFQVKIAMSAGEVIRRVRAAAPSADPARVERFANKMWQRGTVAENPVRGAKATFAARAATGWLPELREVDQSVAAADGARLHAATEFVNRSPEVGNIVRESGVVRHGLMRPAYAAHQVGYDQRLASTDLLKEHAQSTPREEVSRLLGDVGDDELTGLLGNIIPKAPPRPPAPPPAVQALRARQAMAPKLAFDTTKFLEGARVAALPALGGVMGAGLATSAGIDPLTGEIIGAALGATPELVHALMKHQAPHATPAVQELAKQVAAPQIKQAFTESQFSGGLGPGPFHNYASFLSAQPVAGVQTVQQGAVPAVDKKQLLKQAGLPTTPAGRLAASKRTGVWTALSGSKLNTGPSVADISKPEGFGKALAGATKNGT